jgi:hypothetical protein
VVPVITLLAVRLSDALLEQVRRNFAEAIAELQQRPDPRVLANITLQDGIATPVPHKLGRAAAWVAPSAVRGASTSGRVEEVRDGTYDRTKFVTLKATGYGATITVDVVVL